MGGVWKGKGGLRRGSAYVGYDVLEELWREVVEAHGGARPWLSPWIADN